MNELERAKELFENSQNNDDENLTFLSELKSSIKANQYDTISTKYEANKAYITYAYGGKLEQKCFDCTKEIYENNLFELFGVDKNERYNCSKSRIIDGVRTRTFCIMPPFVETPLVTISTTKEPPSELKSNVPDEIWNSIVHGNFIIVGASGSGKTYLMNYLLKKFIEDNERICIIEEFGELIPPSNFTESIIVPPPKPNEPSLLKFITEQSNLMRFNAIYVGEIKSGEAWPFVVNLGSGTRGGCTMHGKNPTHALNRLKALCREVESNSDAIDDFIAKSINYVIVMKDKRVETIHQLTGTHNKGMFALQEIYPQKPKNNLGTMN